MSVPEPPPKNKGFDVTKELIHMLRHYPHVSRRLVSLVEERQEYGVQKYGQSLMSNDGRNGLEDARQELGDLIQYLYKVYGDNMDEKHSAKEYRDFYMLWEEAKKFIDDMLLKR